MDNIDRLLAYQIAARHYPGALVHVEREGRVLARRCVGLLQPDSDVAMHERALFRIASLTKPVVSCAALIQVGAGLLALDAPASDYLPVLGDLRMKSGARPDRAPTVRDLMRHTSGLAYASEVRDAPLREEMLKSDLLPQMPIVDANRFLATLAALPLAAQPGTAFRYGYSCDVLGMIVAAIDGLPLGESLRKRIFEPLSMNETGFELPADGAPRLASAYAADAAWHALVPGYGLRKQGEEWMESGGGGLLSTLGDYARFARMLSRGGRVGDDRLLDRGLFAEMCRDQLPEGADGPLGYTGPGFGFGLGLAVRLNWGSAAMPCHAGELAWSGLSGTALFVQPDRGWFALAFTSNLATRMMARMELRRAVELL